jgi:acetyl-CoA carboxylase carboxyltransferase component
MLATRSQHMKGKLTARERIDLLLDSGSFVETGAFVRHRATDLGLAERRPPTDGVVTGWGTVYGRRVCVFSQDARVFGGSLGEAFAAKVHKILDLAAATGVPVIGLNDGGGARIQEGVAALAGFGGIFARHVSMSGVIPQISVILGPCAGGAAYSPALTDMVFAVEGLSAMYVTGPDVVATVTGEDTDHHALGGAAVHARQSGVATFLAENEHQCLEDVRYLVSFLPSNNGEAPPFVPPTDRPDRRCPELLETVPVNSRKTYDVRDVMTSVLDDGEYLELHENWAANIICALARLDGHTIGVVANQPAVLAGALDIAASEKAARFVRFCDAFNIPLVTFVDVPGFLPGAEQEHAGIVRHGAKLAYAYCEATVPRIQVVLRKAYGGAYIVMDSRSIGTDLSLAWPYNEIAVMGAEAAVNVVFRHDVAATADPEVRRRELLGRYAEELMHPYAAAELGLVDDVINPADTRIALIRGLGLLRGKRDVLPTRKHGNIPL